MRVASFAGPSHSTAAVAEKDLERGEEPFNRIEVGRVGRQMEEACALVLDGFADAGDLVSFNVVQNTATIHFFAKRRSISSVKPAQIPDHNNRQHSSRKRHHSTRHDKNAR